MRRPVPNAPAQCCSSYVRAVRALHPGADSGGVGQSPLFVLGQSVVLPARPQPPQRLLALRARTSVTALKSSAAASASAAAGYGARADLIRQAAPAAALERGPIGARRRPRESGCRSRPRRSSRSASGSGVSRCRCGHRRTDASMLRAGGDGGVGGPGEGVLRRSYVCPSRGLGCNVGRRGATLHATLGPILVLPPAMAI